MSQVSAAMRSIRASIGKKVVISVGGAVALLLCVIGVVVVQQVASLMNTRTYAEVASVVQSESIRISGFIAGHGYIVETMLANTTMLDWFASRRSQDQPFLDAHDYAEVSDFLSTVVDSHPTVVSVFFGVERSGEYFANPQEGIPNGRFNQEGYVLVERPWWSEALKLDRLYAASPVFDVSNGNVVVTIQTIIAAGVEEQTATTSEIARTISDVARSVNDIVGRIAEIAAEADATREASGITHESADELASLAVELERIVGRFRY